MECINGNNFLGRIRNLRLAIIGGGRCRLFLRSNSGCSAIWRSNVCCLRSCRYWRFQTFCWQVFTAQFRRLESGIVKLEVIAAVVVVVEVVLQRYPVVAAIGLDNQVIAFACKSRLLCLSTLKMQGIGLFVVVAVVFDHVFAMSGTEQIGITFSSATFQMVITGASFQRVMSGSTVETVVAFSSVQSVIAAVSIQRVIAFSAVQHIIAITAI